MISILFSDKTCEPKSKIEGLQTLGLPFGHVSSCVLQGVVSTHSTDYILGSNFFSHSLRNCSRHYLSIQLVRCHNCSLLPMLHFQVCFPHTDFMFTLFSRYTFLVITTSNAPHSKKNELITNHSLRGQSKDVRPQNLAFFHKVWVARFSSRNAEFS